MLERIGGERCCVQARRPGPILTIVGNPIICECLWPHLWYPTFRSRWIEHGEILRLTIIPANEAPRQRIDLTGVVDLYGNYERIEDLTGVRWVCRRADDFAQVPKQNLVAECECKILFKSDNVDDRLANRYPLGVIDEMSSCSDWPIRSTAMTWPQQCGVGDLNG